MRWIVAGIFIVAFGLALLFWLRTGAISRSEGDTAMPRAERSRNQPEERASDATAAAASSPDATRGAAEDAAAPEARAWVDPDGRPSEELVRAALEGAITEQLPGHKLSSYELERLALAASALRSAQEELRALPLVPENVERRRALLDDVEDAGAVFDEVLGMSVSEFTEAVQPDVGVDTWSEGEAVPEPEFLRDFEPRAAGARGGDADR